MDKPVLSICIPTYNRGRCAYDAVMRALEYKGDDVEVFVLDNDSVDDTLEYLKKIDDKRFRFAKNDYNIRAVTFSEIFKYAAADFCMWLSDEDNLDTDLLPEIIEYIKSNPSTGAIMTNILNTSGELVYDYGERQILKAGSDAVSRLGFTNNYISGTVINKTYLDLDYFKTKKFYDETKNFAHPYPHHFILLQAIEKGDAYITGKVAITQRLEAVRVKNPKMNPALVVRYFEPVMRLSMFENKCEYIFDSSVFDLKDKISIAICSYAADYVIHTLSLFQFILQSKERQRLLAFESRMEVYSDYNTLEMIPEVFDNVYKTIQKYSGVVSKKHINDILQSIVKDRFYPSICMQLSAFKSSFNYFLNYQRLYSYLISNPTVNNMQITEIKYLSESLLKAYDEMEVFFKYVLPADRFLDGIKDFHDKVTAVIGSLNPECEIPVNLVSDASESVLIVIDEWKVLNDKVIKILGDFPEVLTLYQDIR